MKVRKVIYIVTCKTKDAKFAKIGYSKNPKRRIKELQYMCPLKLTTFCVIPGTEQTEKLLHNYFKDNKIEWTNEWFKVSKDLHDCLKYWEGRQDKIKSVQDLLFCRNKKRALDKLRSLYPETYITLFNRV